MTGVETVERLDDIIRIQSRIIDDLFLMLAQHVNAEELDGLPVVERINQATKMRQESREG